MIKEGSEGPAFYNLLVGAVGHVSYAFSVTGMSTGKVKVIYR